MQSKWFFLALMLSPLGLGHRATVSADEGAPPAEPKVIVRYNISYADEGDSSRIADIYQPDSEGRLPAIVMIHGGAWMAGDKSYDAVHARKFAAAGYVVMVINYRLAPAHKYPAQIDDCFEAIRWLVSRAEEYRVDGDRIGVWGYSAGGHLAALVATNPRYGIPRVKACVAGGAPCDLRLIPDNNAVLSGFLGGTQNEIPEIYETASPIHHVSPDDPPMLLFHGEADRLVPIDFVLGMRRQLEDHQVEYQFLPLENKTHIMAFVDKDAIRRSIDFFNQHLKKP
jgi:acetyl esterase/lipase